LKFIQTIIYSNIWIALGATSLTLETYLVLNFEFNFYVLFFVFFSTLFTYNFQRIIKIKNTIYLFKSEHINWMKKNIKWVYAITIVSFFTAFYLLFFLKVETFFLLPLIGFFSFFYICKIPFLKQKNLREIQGIKLFVISITWTLTCVFFPFFNNELQVFSSTVLMYALSVFLFMISITIPFDIRDMEKDEKEIKTIPQILGEKKSIYLALFFLTLSVVLKIILVEKLVVGILIFFIITSVLYLKSNHKKSELYFLGWIDGLFIISIVLLILNKYLIAI